MKGLELNELFYREIVAKILKSGFPDLKYSAALIGWGSEVLGFDDEVSTDHNWGLRFQIFLREKDFPKFSDSINQTLNANLPKKYRGFSTDFKICVNEDQRGSRKNAKHNIDIETIEEFFTRYLGCHPYREIKAADWLTFPEHKLSAVTSGRIFYDESGKLETVRRKFAYYPRDVWFYLLAAQWSKIFEEQSFAGRCEQTGDEIGSKLIEARQIENLMRLCFLIERRYAPYSKWFGTAFSSLDCAKLLLPVFEKLLRARIWRERQSFLAQSCREIIRLYNNLKITEPMDEEVSEHAKSRPFMIIKDESVIEKLEQSIGDDEVKKFKVKIGSVSQFIDSNDKLNNVNFTRKLKMLYK